MLKVTFKAPKHPNQPDGDATHPVLTVVDVVRVVRRRRTLRLIFADRISALRACQFLGGRYDDVEHNEVVVHTDRDGGFEIRYMHYAECEVADLHFDRIC